MKVPVLGRLQLDLYEKAGGRLLSTTRGRNLIVDVGKALLANLCINAAAALPQYLAIGTSGTAAAAGQTALLGEITTSGGARAAGALSRTTTAATDDTARVEVTFTFTGSFAIQESGLFDAASGGTMLARRTFTTINVVNGNVLVATWTIQF